MQLHCLPISNFVNLIVIKRPQNKHEKIYVPHNYFFLRIFFFQCAEIRKKNIFVDDPSIFTDKCPCLIKVVIQEAEELFRDRLRSKSLRWLYDQVHSDFPEDKKIAIGDWIKAI